MLFYEVTYFYMKQVNCPNCGASMEFEDNREFAFCSFCGTKIMLNEKVTISRKDEIQNLLNRAYEYEEKHDYLKAKDYCNRVLDIDSSNEYARALEERLQNSGPIKNIHIQYKSALDEKFKLRITLDGFNWIEIQPNGEYQMQLPPGRHNILLAAGKKQIKQRVEVSNSRDIITVTYNSISRFKHFVTVDY